MSVKTKSEEIFEQFLNVNDVQFRKIEEAAWRTPDYLVTLGNVQLIFEVKELTRDENFDVVENPSTPEIKVHSRTIGDHIRKRIRDSQRQIQYGTDQGIASILLIYNSLDSGFQMFGTEDTDFIAAMNGEYTVSINTTTGNRSAMFNGQNQSFQECKNTSFSAIGRLSDIADQLRVTLFENVFAKVQLPFEVMPTCFDVRRIRKTLT